MEKALNKHVLGAMSAEQQAHLLCAYPYMGAQHDAALQEPAHHSKSAHGTNALRLLRALVERVADADSMAQLPAVALAAIARTHVCHWQGLDAIGVAMSRQLGVLTNLSPAVSSTDAGSSPPPLTNPPAACHATPEVAETRGGRRGDDRQGLSSLFGLSIKQLSDLLLGFTLVGEAAFSDLGSHKTASTVGVMWALLEAALHAAQRQAHLLEHVAAAQLVVELLWSLSVVPFF